jgi:hypothetical protein
MIKLIALVTILPGEIAPGEVFSVPEEHSESLVQRGFAKKTTIDAKDDNKPAGADKSAKGEKASRT